MNLNVALYLHILYGARLVIGSQATLFHTSAQKAENRREQNSGENSSKEREKRIEEVPEINEDGLDTATPLMVIPAPASKKSARRPSSLVESTLTEEAEPSSSEAALEVSTDAHASSSLNSELM